jgi:hypothetical protein
MFKCCADGVADAHEKVPCGSFFSHVDAEAAMAESPAPLIDRNIRFYLPHRETLNLVSVLREVERYFDGGTKPAVHEPSDGPEHRV